MNAIAKEAAIERELRRAESRWRWLRLGTALSIFGIVACLVLAGFGGAVLAGWVDDMMLAQVCLGLLAFGTLIVGLGVLVVVATGSMQRTKLADAIEDVHRPLMDRLNTLVSYEKVKPNVEQRSYLTRVSTQAKATIAQKKPGNPFSPVATWVWLTVLLFFVVGVTVFWLQTNPFGVLSARAELRKQADAELEATPELDLSLPEANVTEFNSVWGEVRISEPGSDLKLTKVDVVPLQIEAASNQALKEVFWSSSVNGQAEVPHPLDTPSEPNYAAYQPTVYLDEYGLSDWDVLSYYASAAATNGDNFASDIYFIEIRPFREDILKQSGGGGNPGDSESYDILSLLTALIDRQRDILRETHRYHQKPQTKAELKEQDRQKLVTAESELKDSTTHAYAKVAALENMPVGEVLDHLGKAEQWMVKAVGALEDDSPEDAAQFEHSALRELVATRKIFQKTVSDNPQPSDKPSPLDESPVADQIEKSRSKEQKAQQQMNDLVKQQKELSQQAGAGGSQSERRQQAQKQEELRQELSKLQSENPEMFEGLDKQLSEAKQTMQQSASAMKSGKNSKQQADRAHDKLQDLQNAMSGVEDRLELQHAYQLKKSLDQQVDQLDQMANKTEGPSPQEQKDAADNATTTMEQMKEIAGQQPKGMGEELQQELSGPGQKEREQAMKDLAQGRSGEAGKEAAGKARDALKELSQAFDKSQPETMEGARENDPLGDGTPQEQMDRAEQQLESMAKRMEDGKELSDEEMQKQLDEAKRNLLGGMRGNPDYEDKVKKLMDNLDQGQSKNAKELTPEQIRKILSELETLRVELGDRMDKEGENAMTHQDPSKWPAQYRDRIRKYFEKLSEQ